jgi:2-polyprenyl-6-methoxyphenol hydroxylase-like FAD-dependent oxidoreductase
MLIDNKRIAIVGGGPGGLTLARLLQMKGADVKVYERDVNRQARVQGATLDLHEESGLAVLNAAGLMPAFLANYRPGAGKLRVLDKYATIKLDGHDQQDIEERRPEIDRGPLRNMLLDSLQPDTVIWDSQFETMSPQGDGWQLKFRNGTTAYADIVIAADGANSRIRPFITPIKPFYSGITVVEGAVYNSETASPRMHELLKGGKIFAFGDSKSLIVSSKGDGSMAFYTGSWVPEDWAATSGIDFKNKEQVIEWFKIDFAGWDGVWIELFENAEPYFTLRPQYCMPLDQSWDALPNLTMLGDAAHLMPPYAGEGVNMAMLDSLELSQCLTEGNFETVQEAIAHYETNMRKRASETAQTTLDSTEMLHCKDSADRLIAMFNSFDEHQ